MSFDMYFNNILYIIKHYLNKVPLKHPEWLLLYVPLFILIIFLVKKNFIKFSKKSEAEEYKKSVKGMRRFVLFTRLLIALLFVIAIASPYILKQKEIQGDLSITLLTDSSDSFNLFDPGISKRLKENLEEYIPVNVAEIASDDRSPIGDGILNNIRGHDSILVVSDGNNNYGRELGDVLLFASKLNSTINAVKIKPKKDDTNIILNGPKSSIVGSEVNIAADVTQVGAKSRYRVVVEVDGNMVINEDATGSNSFSFTKQLSEGYHKITGKVFIDDNFKDNNEYHKTINVMPKPKLLFINEKNSPLRSKLIEMYNVDEDRLLPKDISPYSAIIINNIPKERFSDKDVSKLTDYVIEGGGLLVVGGESAYDLGEYKDSLFETLLPAKSGEGEKEPEKKVNIVLVLDISGSTGSGISGIGGDKKVDVEKALAARILEEDIRDDDRVGVVAFNSQGYVISPVTPLGPKRESLINLMASLQDGGGTDVQYGIWEAEKLMMNMEGSKNIILISDGVTIEPEAAASRVSGARIGGIKTFSVGVGDDTDEGFMKSIAKYGDGIYFRADQSQHLKILFGEPEDDEKERKNLIVLNSNHFITDEIELLGELNGYNQVVPKASASNLVTTGQGHPVLVVWRFGLGRVGTIATDDGERWGSALLTKQNSKIITRTINWLIGDPSKARGYGVLAFDTNIGEQTEILVRSDYQPKSDIVEFTKIDNELYKGVFVPKETGFINILDAKIAVNYKKEYEKIGLNPELEGLVLLTKGEMFDEDDTKGIIEKTKSATQRIEMKETSLRWPFLAAALLIFLFEIIIRRIKESKGK